MKVRTDFVTNSSSSSFILARTSELNEKQKEEILKYVEGKFLGEPILTPESTEEEIAKVFEDDWDFGDEDTQQKVRDVLKAGRSVYSGYVCYEECDYHYAKVFEKIWEIMKEHGEDDFVKIDGDLSY